MYAYIELGNQKQQAVNGKVLKRFSPKYTHLQYPKNKPGALVQPFRNKGKISPHPNEKVAIKIILLFKDYVNNLKHAIFIMYQCAPTNIVSRSCTLGTLVWNIQVLGNTGTLQTGTSHSDYKFSISLKQK